VANQKIQLRDGEHALLLVEGQVAGGEDGEQLAELGRRRQYLKRKKNIF
jgi:5-deoxy-D-glucuronate isomerase